MPALTRTALGLSLGASLIHAGCSDDDPEQQFFPLPLTNTVTATPQTFQVTVTNAFTGSTPSPYPLAGGVWTVHDGGEALFTAGAVDRGLGLEAIAEDGDSSTLICDLGVAARAPATGLPVAPCCPATPPLSMCWPYPAITCRWVL
jgi:hypothetical protein